LVKTHNNGRAAGKTLMKEDQQRQKYFCQRTGLAAVAAFIARPARTAAE